MRYQINIDNFTTTPTTITETVIESDSKTCKAEMLRQFRLIFPQSAGINFTGKELSLKQIYLYPTKYPESVVTGRVRLSSGKSVVVQVLDRN